MTAVGAFMDRAHAPDAGELAAALGPSLPRWSTLEEWVAEAYGVPGEWTFSGRETGWAKRYRRGGRSLLWLFPRPGAVRALVVVGPAVWERVGELRLSPATDAALREARAYPDGRWLYVSVDSDEVAADVRRLVAAKSPPPAHPRRPAGA